MTIAQVPIQSLPNQQFTLSVDGNEWNIALRTVQGCMTVSFALNGVPVLSNIRAVAGSLLIPYVYMESGNFMFITQNNQMPDYLLFGTTQSMVYASEADLINLRATPALPLTAAYFNPNGALPLRFSPRGYLQA